MADSKVTALTELTAFTGDETFYVVEDDDGTPASRRMTVENLAAALAARAEFTGAFAPVGTGVLEQHTHAPGSDTTIGTTTSATIVDVDATNLVITFNAPASGAVRVTLEAMADVGAVQAFRWGIREASTLIDEAWVNSATPTQRYSVSFIVTGLTPGAAHTYKWAYRVAGGATTRVYGGPTYGKAILSVEAINA